MKKAFVIGGLLLAAVSVSGCATVTRGKTDTVTFTPSPSGAAVKTSMGTTCQTPCHMEISRKQAFYAAFTKGKKTRQVRVNPTTSAEGVATGAGNVIAGGLIGIAVDASSGATLDHVPNPVHVDFSQPQAKAQQVAMEHYKKVKAAKQKKPAKSE